MQNGVLCSTSGGWALPTQRAWRCKWWGSRLNSASPSARSNGGCATALRGSNATDRSASHYTLTVKTFSGTGVTLATGAKALLYSDGTNVNKGMVNKGYKSTTTSYTAVDGDQIICDTSGGVLTITLPTGPSIGSEVSVIDGGQSYSINALTVAPGAENIAGSAGDITVSTDNENFTLVYVNATVGWTYKDDI